MSSQFPTAPTIRSWGTAPSQLSLSRVMVVRYLSESTGAATMCTAGAEWMICWMERRRYNGLFFMCCGSCGRSWRYTLFMYTLLLLSARDWYPISTGQQRPQAGRVEKMAILLGWADRS